MPDAYDVICIGAGPTGLACAIEAKRAGMHPLVIDKGCLCNSLYHYPVNMTFFTTPERMEIGDLPMTIAAGKPTRAEALHYYRRAVEHYGIETRLYETVDKISGHDGAFVVHTHDESGVKHEFHGKKIIIATGYYDRPNPLDIPGESLPHVSHYFTDAHPYWKQNVVVIGGKNSAAEAALDLFRGGAHVTLVHRDAALGKSLKYWVKPDIENRIRAGEIAALFNAKVSRIEPGQSMGEHELARAGLARGAGFCDDRLSSRFRISRAAGNPPRPSNEKAADESGKSRKQCTWDLRRRRRGRRDAHRRNLHRKRPLPRPPNHRRHDRQRRPP